jgi:hypothetical protein
MWERVIEKVESGASRARRRLSGSSAFGRRAAARPNRGIEASRRWRSIRIFYWGLIEKHPDLTLDDEVVLAMRKHKILGSRTAVFCARRRNEQFLASAAELAGSPAP